MDKIIWNNKEWYTNEEWGLIHPDKPWNWYNKDCIEITKDNTLRLHVKDTPRTFELPDGEGGTKIVNSSYGIGLVSSVDYYEYGEFEIMAKLPRGKGLWPAFWLYDHNDWPPEIDIFEGYSGKRGDYKNGCIKRLFYPYNVESCFHSHQELAIPNVRPLAYKRSEVKLANYNPFDFNTYSLRWRRESLTFRVNGVIVRVITNPDIMNYLADRKMRVVINTHIQIGYDKRFTQESPFEIYYFYYKKF